LTVPAHPWGDGNSPKGRAQQGGAIPGRPGFARPGSDTTPNPGRALPPAEASSNRPLGPRRVRPSQEAPAAPVTRKRVPALGPTAAQALRRLKALDPRKMPAGVGPADGPRQKNRRGDSRGRPSCRTYSTPDVGGRIVRKGFGPPPLQPRSGFENPFQSFCGWIWLPRAQVAPDQPAGFFGKQASPRTTRGGNDGTIQLTRLVCPRESGLGPCASRGPGRRWRVVIIWPVHGPWPGWSSFRGLPTATLPNRNPFNLALAICTGSGN